MDDLKTVTDKHYQVDSQNLSITLYISLKILMDDVLYPFQS